MVHEVSIATKLKLFSHDHSEMKRIWIQINGYSYKGSLVCGWKVNNEMYIQYSNGKWNLILSHFIVTSLDFGENNKRIFEYHLNKNGSDNRHVD